jgi:hypothetical protein
MKICGKMGELINKFNLGIKRAIKKKEVAQLFVGSGEKV